MEPLRLLVLVISVLKLSSGYEVNDGLLVELSDGKVLGRALVSNAGRTIRAFTGIPYAAPPIGNLRFKPAQKVTPWNNTLRAQGAPRKCLQFNPFIRSFVVEGQEDCLTLNVYTPQGSDGEESKKLPVIVWIHGGGWTRGESYVYGPEYLLDHDVILVSGEYRVGVFGFLSSEDRHLPGNYGHKDQTAMLRWVQANIERFGGDKDAVTIWGESAGGASVHYHMYSPLSRGLFHRAISHSGSLHNCWSDPARPGVARRNFFEIASKAGCVGDSSEQVVACLRDVDAERLTEIASKSYFWDNDPVVIHPVVIESFDSDEEAFIAEREFAEHSVDIPWLIGMNSEEGLLKVGAMLDDKAFLDDLLADWDEILPHSFYYDHLDSNQRNEITRALNEFYFGNETLSTATMSDARGLIEMWTDGWFIGIFESLKNRFERGVRNNTYVFFFSHRTTASFSQTRDFHGTCHVDDLIPLFALRKSYYYSSLPTQHDRELTEKMTRMWTNFAVFGNPTPEGTAGVPLWPTASDVAAFKYMQIGNQNGHTESLFQVRENYFVERASFWMGLREKFSLNSWHAGNSVAPHSSVTCIALLLAALKILL